MKCNCTETIKNLSIAFIAIVFSTNAITGNDNILQKNDNLPNQYDEAAITAATSSILHNADSLKELEGSDYAGTWIQYRENGIPYQIIATINPNKTRPSIFPLHDVVYVTAKHTYAYLEEIKSKFLEEYMLKINLITSISIDDSKNAVVIRVQPKNIEKLAKKLAEHPISRDSYIIEESNLTPILWGDLETN